MEALTTCLTDVSSVFINMPVNLSEKFNVLYLLTFIGLAYFSFRRYYRRKARPCS